MTADQSSSGIDHAVDRGARMDDPRAGSAAPAPFKSPSKWPAVSVVALALLILAGGMVASALTAAPPASLSRHPRGSADLLRSISSAGQPPSDILAALDLPAGTVPFAAANEDHGAGLYDRSAGLCSPGTPASSIAFLRAHLIRSRWTILAEVKLAQVGQSAPGAALLSAVGARSAATSTAGLAGNRRYALAVLSATSAGAGTEIIARHASNDGYYWEAGLVVAGAPVPAPSNRRASCAEMLLNLFELHLAM